MHHYNWMLGFMRWAAKKEGFKLELRYDAHISKGAMRTVIFNVYPESIDIPVRAPMTSIEAISKFWMGVENVQSHFQSHNGILVTDYFRKMLKDCSKFSNSDQKILDDFQQWISGFKTPKVNPLKENFFIGTSDKIHKGGFKCASFKRNITMGVEMLLKPAPKSGSKCIWCFGHESTDNPSQTKKRSREEIFPTSDEEFPTCEEEFPTSEEEFPTSEKKIRFEELSDLRAILMENQVHWKRADKICKSYYKTLSK